jgi:hypothetical protein
MTAYVLSCCVRPSDESYDVESSAWHQAKRFQRLGRGNVGDKLASYLFDT